MADNKNLSAVVVHGASRLPSVEVDSYNVELKDDEGFLGDRASKGAFTEIVDNWRKVVRKGGDDPFGDTPTDELSKKQLDELFARGDPEAAGIIHGAIEDFAQELALVIRRFLKIKAWAGTERIVIGGGFRARRIGELSIGRASVILKADKVKVDLVPIRNEPDEAGLLGAAHLAPAWMFKAHDAILAVDIGGSNIRAGIVNLNLNKKTDLSKACVWKYELWRHADENNVKRDEAIDNLVGMLSRLVERAQTDKIKLAPFIGIGCPGKIEPDGSIDRGAQNLPGNWESSRFNLPTRVYEAIPKIRGDDTAIVLHNDAVVQGLSETPFMQDVDHWAALTIGTGLGNARFTNRHAD